MSSEQGALDPPPPLLLSLVTDSLKKAKEEAKEALRMVQEGTGRGQGTQPQSHSPAGPAAVRVLVAALDARRSRGVQCGPRELVQVADLVRLCLDAIHAGELHQLGRSLMILG